ncbi:2-oxoglutarate-dependent dioxygenase AOP2-like [Hibiscus syriacus]|uniref:2-oxoglutarate-dependent dioxygenase AOP2-like n=1 Tax=Hibiscus syriacus TaxID=106335 RepID=A0A6A2X393_HIBSY|nr:probable 2-oxoglutarate-dependent dioxygenase AOP1 [Hibiscus syriacus]KAE8669412.1 2-oxoglutarate-dependent dioxygenase AOP2-like [Hibiscus syriacus]
MGLESYPKLPVIDFSDENLKPGSSGWAPTCNDVRRALEEYGCFEAKFEKISPQVHGAAFAGAEELFDLPTEVKTKNTSNKPYFEYFGQYKSLPLYESLAIDHPTSFDSTASFTNLMWPAGNDRFRESAQSYSELVTELDRTVARMLFESYGVGYYYDYYSNNTNYLLRYFKYNEPTMEQSNEGLLPHADKTLFSILHQGKVSGLQVKVKDDQWVDIPPSPTSFIVMAGEALLAWSNDRIPSCYHQVILKEKGTRYSLGMFSFISGTVHILEELGYEAHPIKYKSFNHFDFLHYVKLNLGPNSNPCFIKDFAGV